MEILTNYVAGAKKSWKTSLIGLFLLMVGIYLLWQKTITEAMTAIGMGLGFLSAKDADVTGTAKKEAEKNVQKAIDASIKQAIKIEEKKTDEAIADELNKIV